MALPTADLTQTIAVKPVPLPQIPLGMYNPDVFGAGLGAGLTKASEDGSQVVQLQRHMDASTAAMDAEGQFSQDSADMLVGYREKIQSMTGEELKEYTKKFQRQVDEQQKLRGAKLTDPLAAQEYAKRAGAHADRLYQVAGEVSFQRQVAYRGEVMKAQEKITVDAAGVVVRGADGLPVGGAAKVVDLQNAANALYSFAEGVHNDPSMVTLQGGVVYLNPAGKAKIQETTSKALNELLGAYSIKPREGLALLKMTYPGTSDTVADVLGADASRWQRAFSDGDKAQTASGLGYEAQKKFGQNDRAAGKWIEQQIKAQYPNPEEASAVSAAAVNQYTHFANQKIQRINTLEAQALKSGDDRITAAGGLEELLATKDGAAYWATVPGHMRRPLEDASNKRKTGDPTSSFQRAAAEYQAQNDANPLHAFDGWTPLQIEEAALKVGPLLAPALRKMIHENRTKKALDKPAITAARSRVNDMLITEFNLQKDPADPTKPTFTGVPLSTQLAFTGAQLMANAEFKRFEDEHREGAPSLNEIAEIVSSIAQQVVIPRRFSPNPKEVRFFPEEMILPLALAQGVEFTIPYDQIPAKRRARIEKVLDARGIPDKLKNLGSRKEVVEKVYMLETLDLYHGAGLVTTPITGSK